MCIGTKKARFRISTFAPNPAQKSICDKNAALKHFFYPTVQNFIEIKRKHTLRSHRNQIWFKSDFKSELHTIG